MKMLIKLFVIMSALVGNFASAVDIIHYNKKAVTIELQVGEERTIHFGDHVKAGITKGMKAKRLFRIQSAQGSLHILAHTTFDKQRIQIKRLTDNQIILLDLVSVKSGGKTEDVKIILPFENKTQADEETGSNTESTIKVITPIDLTKYASQILYGPARLHLNMKGINSSTIGMKGNIKIFKGENKLKTETRAVLSYEGGGYYITALIIKNKSLDVLTLNYLDLNIPFSHATFQHHKLTRNGTNADTTVLYLVDDEPMKTTLYPWSYYQDLNAIKNVKEGEK